MKWKFPNYKPLSAMMRSTHPRILSAAQGKNQTTTATLPASSTIIGKRIERLIVANTAMLEAGMKGLLNDMNRRHIMFSDIGLAHCSILFPILHSISQDVHVYAGSNMLIAKRVGEWISSLSEGSGRMGFKASVMRGLRCCRQEILGLLVAL
jgi:hypothetical protein